MKQVIKQAVICVVGVAAAFVALDYAMTGSDVKVSYSTNKCVSVENFDGMFFKAGDYSCENMPEKFNHIWVK